MELRWSWADLAATPMGVVRAVLDELKRRQERAAAELERLQAR